VGIDCMVAAENHLVGNFVVFTFGAHTDIVLAGALDLSGSGD
jgi:hypothetical protein